jgi:hypothetical protein
MTELTEVEAKLKALDLERADLLGKILPMQERVREISTEMEPLREQRDRIRYEVMPIDWKTVLKELVGEHSALLRRRVEKEVRERFGMMVSGYWSDTRELCLKVCVDRRLPDSKSKVVEGVKFFAPLLAPHTEDREPDEAAYVWFGIHEHTLSQYGVYRLEVLPDLSKARLSSTVYMRYSVVEEFTSVEAAVDYIDEHHWWD